MYTVIQRAMNRAILRRLEVLRKQHEEEGDENRERAYSRAIEVIQQQNRPIRSGYEAMELPGIGKGIAWRIDQVLGIETDEDKTPPPKREARRSAASNTNRTAPPPPSPHVRIAFVDSQSRSQPYRRSQAQKVPTQSQPRQSRRASNRDDGERVLETVQQIFKRCSQSAHIALAGDYRRGQKKLPRLVFLCTEKSMPKSTQRTERMIQTCIERLPIADENAIGGDSRYRTIKIRMPTAAPIQCTFIAIPAAEWPFALLCYTGPKEFFAKLQHYADSKGYRLTDRALYKDGYVSVTCRTERDIFQSLGLNFIPPTAR